MRDPNEKRYETSDGEAVTLDKMVRVEPGWAASRIRAGEEAIAECDRLRAKLEEREADMHARVRAGYDGTVADCWRAAIAKAEGERDRLRREVKRLRDVAALPFGESADLVKPTPEGAAIREESREWADRLDAILRGES